MEAKKSLWFISVYIVVPGICNVLGIIVSINPNLPSNVFDVMSPLEVIFDALASPELSGCLFMTRILRLQPGA